MYGAPGHVNIGNLVVGGTPGSVLFVGATGGLAQDNANLFFNVTSNQLQLGNGSAAAPSHSFKNLTQNGVWAGTNRLNFAVNGIDAISIPATPGLLIRSTGLLGFGDGLNASAASFDTILVRDAANILALKNSTIAQTARIYGTTTASVFLALNHDGTNANISASAGVINLNTISTMTVDRGLRYTNQTDQAGVAVGTLANAPAAGDPAFWVPVTVNGTNRAFPVW